MSKISEAEQKRIYLNWWCENGSLSEISRDYPDCVCETAKPVECGFGQVRDEEKLRYFASSTSDINYKKQPNKEIGSEIFSRIFVSGVSVVRLDFAERSELNLTAQILYNFQVERNPSHGGIVGVVDFQAKEVRFPINLQLQTCCVLDTPIQERMSHADIISNSNEIDKSKQNQIKRHLFNSIGGKNAFKLSQDVSDTDLSQMVPKMRKKEPNILIE